MRSLMAAMRTFWERWGLDYREPVNYTDTKNADRASFPPTELAGLWGFSGRFVRELFRDEPGVIIIDRPEQMHKRGYATMRIPESVCRSCIRQTDTPRCLSNKLRSHSL